MKSALLAMLVLVTVCLAQPVQVSDAGYANVTMVIEGSSSREQTVFVPAADSRQRVQYPEGLDVKRDEMGNSYITVRGAYSYVFSVEVNGQRPILLSDQSFPIKERVLEEYLADTNYVIVSDPDTQKRASDVTTNSRTTLGAITALVLWVNSYVTYDQGYGGELLSSREVLRSRRGWCGEFSNLYTAMARHLGIPTRITTGMVYTGSRWERHGWAESYVNGAWIPVDGTYGEIGHINALHVKLYSAPTYLFYMLPDTVESIRITDFTAKPYDLPLLVDAGLSAGVVAPRGVFHLNANVTNNGSSIAMPTYYAQKTLGVELVDDFRKNLILYPGETKQLSWKFIAPFGERERYYVVFGGPGTELKFPIEVDPNLKADGEAAFIVKSAFSRVEGGQVVIEFRVANTGNQNLQSVKVSAITSSLGTQQDEIDLRVGEEKLLVFRFPAQGGIHSFEARVEAAGAMKNAFGVVNVPLSAEEPKEGLLKAVTQYLRSNSSALFVLFIIVLVGIVALILLVPSMDGHKKPFKEKEEWGKLVKLREEKGRAKKE